MFRHKDGEELMTLAFFVFKPDTSESADRQTDTDTRVTEDTCMTDTNTMASQPFLQNPAKSWEKVAIPAVCIARYANVLEKGRNIKPN